MAEYRLIPRPALAGSTPVDNADISLSPLPEGHVIQLIGRGDQATPPPSPPASAVYDAGPGQWLLVGESPLTGKALADYLQGLPDGMVGIDQSHGRVRIRLAGRKAERVLEKGTGADLAEAAFPVGSATTTLLGHVTAHVARTGGTAFELTVFRSFAESLWDDLVRMIREYA
jgi:sarcosine oxidase, subunit gamma